ncbi:MAG: hypothetical protein IKI75_09955 [Lachnospiraceae bacterium]|nr:hypothetical protein [Lachnospiraceae bacterium]
MENNTTFTLYAHRQDYIELDNRKKEAKKRLHDENVAAKDVFLAEGYRSEGMSVQSARENADRLARLLGSEETTRDLKLSSENVKRLEQIRLEGAKTMLQDLGGSDSVEMQEIKRYARRLDDFLDSERHSMMDNEIFDELDLNLQLVAASCEAYIKNPKKRENRRKKVVREYYAAVRYQIDRMVLIRRAAIERAGGSNDYDLSMAYSLETHMGMDRTADAEAQHNALDRTAPARECSLSDMSREIQGIAEMFGEDYKLSDRIAAAKKKERPGLVKSALQVMEELRTIPQDTVAVRNVTIMGVRLRLLQRSDNSVSILDGKREYKLPCSIPTLLDRMEMDMVRNQQYYGNDNMKDFFLRMDFSKYEEGSGEYEFRRQQVCEYLRETTGVELPSLDNIPAEKLRNLALTVSSGLILNTKKEVLDRINEYADQALTNINTAKAQKSRSYHKEHEKNAVRMPEKHDRWDEAAPETEKDWNYEEELMVKLFADMISDSQSFSADRTTGEKVSKGEALRRRMGRHTEAISAFIKDPDYVNEFLEKIPFPDVKMKDGRSLSLYVKEEIGKIQNAPIVGFLRLMPDFVLSSVFSGENLLPIYAQYKEDFEKLAVNLDEMVNTICEELQEMVSEQADEIYGEDKEERKQNVRGGMPEGAAQVQDQLEEEEKEPKTLDKMMESLVKGKKGQGRFNKLIFKGYFKDSDIMDKRCMLASMIRSVKPKRAYELTDEEAIDGLLREKPYHADRFFKDRKVISKDERLLIDKFKKEYRNREVAGAVLGGILKGAGPLMQKVMQGVPLGDMPASMLVAVKDMKSNLLPIPDEYVKDVMNSIVERSHRAISRIEIVRPLGAASVGQAFLCRIYGKKYRQGKDVCIKILRPDAKNRMEREKRIMRVYAEQTDDTGGMLKTFEGQIEGYEKELDLTIESRNVDAGKIYEGQEAEVTSMKMIHDVEAGQDFLVGEKAEGTTIDRYLEDIDKKIAEIHGRFRVANDHKLTLTPENAGRLQGSIDELMGELRRLEKRRDHVCKLCSIWVKEGMMKGGFYHADLHAGNIMVTDEKVTVIDFGNSVKLTPKHQKWISAMLAAASTGDGELFTQAFDELLDKNDEQFRSFYTPQKKEQLGRAFARILNMGNTEQTGQRIMACFLKAQELGVKVPPEIYQFSQGQLRLMNTVDEMNGKLKTLKKAIQDMGGMSVSGENYVNPRLLMAKKVHEMASVNLLNPKYALFWKQEMDNIGKDRKSSFMNVLSDHNVLTMELTAKTMFMNDYLDLYKSNYYLQAKMFPFGGIIKMINDEKAKLPEEGDARAAEIKNAMERIEAEIRGKIVFEAFKKYVDNRAYNGKSFDDILKAGKGGDIRALDDLAGFMQRSKDEFAKTAELMNLTEKWKSAEKRKKDTVALEVYDKLEELDRLMGKSEKSFYRQVLENLSLEGLDAEAAARKDEKIKAELAEMFADKTQGQQLKDAYDRMREVEKNAEAATKEDREKKENARKEFMDLYMPVATRMLKLQTEPVINEEATKYKKNDFIKVMGNIFSDPWLLAKTAWRVGGSLGYRIYKSEGRAKAQRKAERERKQRLEAEKRRREEAEELRRLEEQNGVRRQEQPEQPVQDDKEKAKAAPGKEVKEKAGEEIKEEIKDSDKDDDSYDGSEDEMEEEEKDIKKGSEMIGKD